MAPNKKRRLQQSPSPPPPGVHLVTLLPWNQKSTDDGMTLEATNPFWLSTDAASYLAVRDFNRLSSRFVDLPFDCNFELSVTLRNSQLGPLDAVAALQDELTNHDNRPVAILALPANTDVCNKK